jgi:succinyl-CoA synthetase beta subunit
MDGNIGCLVNGAGLTMATLDCIQDNGGHPANFMDLGAGVNIDKVIAALDILLNDPQVKVVLVNIFGGMTRCDDIAYGLQAAIEKYGTEIPIIVHMGGTHAESGIKILKDLDIIFAPSMIDAVKKAVTIVGGK